MSYLISPLVACASSSSFRSPCKDSSRYRVAVMGASAVGKSAIIGQFLQQKFLRGHWATIQECYTKDLDVDGEDVVMDILDTLGACWFASIRSHAIKNADAFVLVYSVTDEASFESMARIRAMIMKKKGNDVPIVVVGNKTDVTSKPRFLSQQSVGSLVTTDWEHRYMEVSATENGSIPEIFREIATQVRLFAKKGRRRFGFPNAVINRVKRWCRRMILVK